MPADPTPDTSTPSLISYDRYALAETLPRLTDMFQVLPGFAYYDDHDGENAYTTTVRRLARSRSG